MATGRTIGIALGWVGTALATAALAGGGVYLWQSTQVSDLRLDLDAAQRQINELQAGDDSLGRPEPEPRPEDEESSDDRRLISYSDEEGYGVDNLFSCLPNEFDANAFDLADPTTTVTYADELGFSLELPWNPDWGTSRCRVNPYESTFTGEERILLFGPLISGEGGLGRQFVLRTLPARTAAEAQEAIIDEVGVDYITVGPDRDELAGFAVVVFAFSGLCDAIDVEVIGNEDYNFGLSSGCTTPPYEDEMAVYEDILSGLQIL